MAKPATDTRAENAAEWVPTAALNPWPGNPRKNDEAAKKVADSIKRFGFAAPIVARRENNEIIAGHTRWKAARILGMDRVPVRFVDLDPAEAHLLALADNKLNEAAEWDGPSLAQALADYGLEDAALAGFDSKALDELASELGADGPPEETEPPPEPPKDPVTKPGDLWVLGEHRLLCGDCRDPRALAALLGDERVNVCFTSPPYASQRKYDESSGFKPIPPDEYSEWWDAVQANVRSVLAEDGSFFVNIKEHCEDGQRHLYVKKLTIRMVEEWGWRFVDELCWKHHGFPGEVFDRFRNAWEPIFHFTQASRAKCRPQHVAYKSDSVIEYRPETRESMTISSTNYGGAARAEGMAYPRNVLEISNGAGTSVPGHAATFPAALPSFFIRAFSDPDDVILDPFMGSGTTIVACENEGRRGRGTEISPAYCDVIVERWQNLTGGKAERRSA